MPTAGATVNRARRRCQPLLTAPGQAAITLASWAMTLTHRTVHSLAPWASAEGVWQPTIAEPRGRVRRFQSLHDEQGKVRAARDVACQNGTDAYGRRKMTVAGRNGFSVQYATSCIDAVRCVRVARPGAARGCTCWEAGSAARVVRVLRRSECSSGLGRALRLMSCRRIDHRDTNSGAVPTVVCPTAVGWTGEG